MVNKVIDGIAEAINKAFGDEYDIYSEPVLQDLPSKAFTIRTINARLDRFLGECFKRTCLMEINYFPADDLNPRTEIQSVIDNIFDAVEVINVAEGKVRGVQSNVKIVDNVMVFVIKYVFFVHKIENKEHMEELTQTINAQ